MALFDTTWYINAGDGSTTGYYAVSVWASLTTMAPGAIRRQLATPAVGSERCFVCIDATGTGVTGASEPTWVITRGGKTTDGTVTWQECTGQPGLCGDTTNSVVWLTIKNQAVTLGQIIYDSGSSSLQICSTAGTTGSGSTPAFSATAGTTTADNTVTWTSLGLASGFSTPFAYPHARLANAFTATWGAAGNKFAVGSNHAETQSTTLTLTPPGTLSKPCSTYCISNTTTLSSPTLAASATISTTGTTNLTYGISGFSYAYGLNLYCGTGSGAPTLEVGFSNNTAGHAVLENVSLNLNTTGAALLVAQSWDSTAITLVNSAITFGAVTQHFDNTGTFNSFGIVMIGGSIAATGAVPTTLINLNAGNSGLTNFLFRGVDLSALTGTLFAYNNSIIGGTVLFEYCKLGSGVAITSGTSVNATSPQVKVHTSDSASTNYRYYFNIGALGAAQQETTIVRTGGATNGTTPISWNITTSANAMFLQPFVSEELEIWNSSTGSPITVSFYITSNTSLSNNQFWPEVEYLGASGSPLGSVVNSRMAILGTPTALTTDTSTWGGSITNKYICQLTFTPQMAGIVKARFYAAVASATIYVDPEIYGIVTSGRQYFVPGWGMVNEGASGSGGGLLTNPGMQGGIRG